MSRAACDAQVEVVPRIADVPAEAWDACANPDPATFNPFVAHAFLKALEDAGTVGGRTGWTPRHLVLKDGGRRRSPAARPAISSRTARASTCSTTAGPTPTCRPAGATIPSCRSPCRSRRCPGRGCWCGPGPTARPTRRMLAAAAVELVRAQRPLRRAHHVPDRRRMDAARRAGLAAAHRPAVPLEQRRLRARSTTIWPRSPRASARPRARSASRRSPAASRSSGCAGARSREARLGRVLRLLHGDRLAQVGAALSQPQVLLAAGGRAPWATAACSCWPSAAERPIARLVPSRRRRLPVRPLLGRRRAPAVPAFRDVLLPGHRLRHRAQACSAWRPAPRASTSWRAAICRPRPTRPTTSSTRRCAAPSPTSWSASARSVDAACEVLAEHGPYRKNLRCGGALSRRAGYHCATSRFLSSSKRSRASSA